MSFRSILANLNETGNAAAVTAMAGALAREFDATVTGLYVVPAARVYPSAYYEPIPEMFEAHRKHFNQQTQSVRAAFDAAFAGTSVRSDLRVENSPSPLIADRVMERGKAWDLVVVSQTDPSARLGVELDFVPRVAIAAGRPVMVIPFNSASRSMPETVVIGWNGSREAARALFDSLPFLKRATKVHIIWVDPPDGSRKLGDELAQTLDLHGVKASVAAIASNGENTGNALLRKAQELGADLLVIGAYGHSRLSELVLGGVTRTVLRQMTCPVLLSH